ncbi:hypothetical protein NDU88_001407 [Pleurodeles waltl]|uniref:Uncharacterized protein n=1 Tax=Pleurodeles waltl TaxID=8319 RepID=A0AAV7LZH3_PLEWA|nr:hypothetical protein NDU88_001407 [Pleurodeles waltl]
MSAVTHSPGGTSSALLSDPDVVYLAPRNAKRLYRVGPFKTPAEEERRPPPDQKKTEEPTTTLEEKKATEQPSLRHDDQEAAGC